LGPVNAVVHDKGRITGPKSLSIITGWEGVEPTEKGLQGEGEGNFFFHTFSLCGRTRRKEKI